MPVDTRGMVASGVAVYALLLVSQWVVIRLTMSPASDQLSHAQESNLKRIERVVADPKLLPATIKEAEDLEAIRIQHWT